MDADREKVGEVLRQAGAVVGRTVTLWEVTETSLAVVRGSSSPTAPPPPTSAGYELDAALRRWNVPVPVGSRWVAAPPSPDASATSWVIAPVRTRPPAPPPEGRERRSRERLALELAGLALGMLERTPAADRADVLQDLAGLPAFIAHEASNPLAAARSGLQTAMEAIGRWVDLAADRRVALLDDLGQVLEDIDRATEFMRAVQDRTRGVLLRTERFDAVRVVRACLTLEQRLLRDRGIDLDFSTTLESMYLKGDPNALFDLLVTLVRNAAEATRGATPAPVEVRVAHKGRDLEVTVRDQGSGEAFAGSLAKARTVAESVFGGSVRMDAQPGKGTLFTIALPVPPQREGLRG